MLNDTQRATFLAAVKADNTANAFRLAGDAYSLRQWANSVPGVSPTSVWRTEAPVTAILDSITWSNYTPNDPPDGTTLYLNRSINAQIKQMNLQLMLQGRQTLDCSKANVRAGLRDAVIALPTGAGGAAVAAGGASGATTLAACVRSANRIEAALASGTATTGSTTASLLTFEGGIDDGDAAWIVNQP